MTGLIYHPKHTVFGRLKGKQKVLRVDSLRRYKSLTVLTEGNRTNGHSYPEFLL